MDQDPYVKVSYSDGVISQSREGRASGTVQTIKLRNLPFATFDSTTASGAAGSLVPVTVSATGSSGQALRHAGLLPGVKVTLVPPSGAQLKCTAKGAKQVLSSQTDASGRAKLSVCPTRSGTYTLKTQGALSVGSITLLVKGSAPLPVNSVTVRSPGVGVLRASWAKPMYDGGSPVTSYIVKVTAAGQKTITQTLKATVDKKGKVTKAPTTMVNLTKLANGTTYTVNITAVNANGSSDVYTASVPVA
jgi:hypothetical protein